MSGSAREDGDPEKLFGEYQRTDRRSRQPLEDNYTFLDRVDQVYWQKVRDEMERWFADYPASGRAELGSRFRHRDDDQHYGAYWELYLHRLFSCLGYSIEVHPDLPDTTTHPDFRVTKEGHSFLLEATTTFSGIVEEGRAGDREAWILAAIEKASDPNFYVHLEFEKVGTERPSDKEIFEPLQTWLEGLDPDEIASAGLLDAPTLRLTPRDWVVVFRPIPVKPEARGRRPDKGMLGIGPAIAGPVNDVEKIKAGLKRKARKYGKPGSAPSSPSR